MSETDIAEARADVWGCIDALVEHRDNCERECDCRTQEEAAECLAPHKAIDAALGGLEAEVRLAALRELEPLCSGWTCLHSDLPNALLEEMCLIHRGITKAEAARDAAKQRAEATR